MTCRSKNRPDDEPREERVRGARRGDLTLEQTAALLLIAAAAIILLLWWSHVHTAVTGDEEIQRCRLSVLSHAKLWLNPTGTGWTDAHLTPIDCKRRVITFAKKEVELNGRKTLFYDPELEKKRERYRELTPGIVNSVAAHELATCWYQFLEGKSYWVNEIDIGKNDRGCFICSELRFTTDAPSYAPEEFFPFLRREASRPYPKSVPSNEVTGKQERPTFFEYLYTEPRICDHSRSWYTDRADKGKSCEEAFYEYITRRPLDTYWPKQLLNPELKIEKGTSYYVLLFQYGRDQDRTDEKEPTGTTYAPIIMPAASFDTKLCETYLG